MAHVRRVRGEVQARARRLTESKKPFCLYGPLDAWPLAKQLVELLDVDRDPVERCHYIYSTQFDETAASSLHEVKELPRPGLERQIARAFDILVAVGEWVHRGWFELLHQTTAGSHSLHYGFHQSLAFDEALRRLALGFEVLHVDKALASRSQPRPVNEAQLTARVRDRALREHLLEGKRKPASKRGTGGTASATWATWLAGVPVEQWNDVDDRIFGLWCERAAPSDAFTLTAAGDVGADRFRILVDKLHTAGRGSVDDVLRHVFVNNTLPSTGVYVARQLHGDVGQYLYDVRACDARVDAIEWALLPLLATDVHEIDGVIAPLVDAARDPRLIPDETLARLCVHAPAVFQQLLDARAS